MALLRPRLSSHVRARSHRIDGVDRVALHDARTGALILIDTRQWSILEGCDGTRDLEALTLYASAQGVLRRRSELRTFFAELEQEGLLEDGIAPLAPFIDVIAAKKWLAARPLRHIVLQNGQPYRFRCDGMGSCCAQFSSIAFLPEEVHRAHALVPTSGQSTAPRFLPIVGNNNSMSAIQTIEGACELLTPENKCGLHGARGLANDKPRGCQLFPIAFVDDGSHVRVVPRVECSCVLTSLRADPANAETSEWTSVPDGAAVVLLAEHIVVADGKMLARAELVQLLDQAAEQVWHSSDPASFLDTLAATLDGGQSDRSTAADNAMRERLGSAERAAARWRSMRDPNRVARRVLAAAANEAAREAIAAPSEQFYAHVVLFGLQVVESVRPVATAIRERAARIRLARKVPFAGRFFDPQRHAYPLALVEATLSALETPGASGSISVLGAGA